MPNGPKDPDGTQQGDVAISCPDGSVAAAALPGVNKPLFKYPSLQSYIDDYAKNNGGATYLGYGEYIGTIKVIGEDMATNKQIDEWISLFHQEAYGSAPSDEVFKDWRAVLKNNFVEGSLSIMIGTDTNPGALKNQPTGEYELAPPIYIKKVG